MASDPPGGSPLLPEGWSWSDVGHGALDIAGLVPGIGEPADLANAAWLAAEANYLDAGLSVISMVPIVGDAIGKGGKLAEKGAVKLAGPALDAIKKMDFAKVLEPLASNPKLAPHIDAMTKALENWRDKVAGPPKTPQLTPSGKTMCPAASKALREAGAMIGKTPVPLRIIEKMDATELAFFEKKIKELEVTDILPRENLAVFYSGKVDGKLAYLAAEERAFKGELDSVNSLTKDFLNRDNIRDLLPDDAMRFIDNAASKKLAQNAKGVVNFVGDLDSISPTSVYRNIELPELLKNTSISPESRQQLQAMKEFLDNKYGP